LEELTLLRRVERARKELGPKSRKFTGAITVALLREALQDHGIPVSQRDVFIQRVAREIDLLIPKPGAAPSHGILYAPEDVLIALEIKNLGSFGPGTLQAIRDTFSRIQSVDKRIRCFYVSLTERKGYKGAITEENLGHPAYTLSWHYGSGKNMRYESTGDWQRLLKDMKRLCGKFAEDPS